MTRAGAAAGVEPEGDDDTGHDSEMSMDSASPSHSTTRPRREGGRGRGRGRGGSTRRATVPRGIARRRMSTRSTTARSDHRDFVHADDVDAIVDPSWEDAEADPVASVPDIYHDLKEAVTIALEKYEQHIHVNDAILNFRRAFYPWIDPSTANVDDMKPFVDGDWAMFSSEWYEYVRGWREGSIAEPGAGQELTAVVHFWRNQKDRPSLQRQAERALSVTASSAPMERGFSVVTRLSRRYAQTGMLIGSLCDELIVAAAGEQYWMKTIAQRAKALADTKKERRQVLPGRMLPPTLSESHAMNVSIDSEVVQDFEPFVDED
ncbi:MAG: hypothetical protein EOO65_02405 [Methanosarcinales archaeon]|nr:MAG: hypothetical protein EOO65_02405 [Methanosarcinales archaeon]